MKNTLINLVLALCFIIGLVLIFINPIQNYLVAKTCEELTPVQSVPVAVSEITEVAASFDFEEVQSLTIWDVLKAQALKKIYLSSAVSTSRPLT